jgi:hypothetical protein
MVFLLINSGIGVDNLLITPVTRESRFLLIYKTIKEESINHLLRKSPGRWLKLYRLFQKYLLNFKIFAAE